MQDYSQDLESGIIEVPQEQNPYSADKLLGVACFGAVLGLGCYYLYNQLDRRTQSAIKTGAVSLVRSQARQLLSDEE